MKKNRIRLSPLTLPLWAMLLALGGEAALLSLPAVAVHEMGHLAVMRAVGMGLRRLEITPLGLTILPAFPPRSAREGFLVASGGIAANLALCLACLLPPLSFLPAARVMAAMSLGLAAINAIPHPSLDGGAMLRELLSLRLPPDRVVPLCRIAGEAAMLPVALGALYLLFYGLGGTSVYLFCAYLVWSLAKGEDGDGG